MAIPMPGHPVHSREQDSVLDDCRRLHNLIDAHDAVFFIDRYKGKSMAPNTSLCQC